ncbi:MAG TPA: L,D-transpeptidase family protein, partial [Pyrinomonadaceae bacterium]
MKSFLRYALPTLFALTMIGCTDQGPHSGNTTVNQPVPSASPSPSATQEVVHSPLTLPVLDALLTNDTFNSALKSKLQLTTEQIDSLKRVSSSEVARLRQSNAEDLNSDPADARSRASDQIAAVIGQEKTNQLSSLVADAWANGGTEVETGKNGELKMSLKPNAVPTDTRIVVNIPEFRMDLFKNGELVKSYKIGIGYPEFPLPQGLRKAQTIIFNPTWTPPDSPWVASMKNVAPGEKIEAGSKDNPLGPIKIPIGMPSLIHGGKSPAKLGQFASHGCVGLTNAQVKDFAKQLAQATETQLSEKALAAYLQDRTKTSVVKLKQTVPVELRYETIVIEDGRLHIYKDVYDQNTNTEENLRLVLEANGSHLED